MSTMQRMTLIGLYNYEQTLDTDLFANLTLPEGFDRDTFVNSLLLEHGEKCVLYTNPDFFMSAIGIWSSKYSLELSRIYEALTAEYNPIWNYDRNEEWSDKGGKRATSETSGDGTITTNSTSDSDASHRAQDKPNYDDDVTNDYDVTTSNITDGSTEHQVSADNSGSYQPDWKETSNVGSQKTENDGTIKRHIEGSTQDLSEVSKSKAHDKTKQTNKDKSKTVDVSADNSKHLGHIWGNVGVTTSTAMVSEVVKQRFEMSLYSMAIRMFANDLLIGIW